MDLASRPFAVPVVTVECGAKVYVNWGDQRFRCRPPGLGVHITLHKYISLQLDADLRDKEGRECVGEFVKVEGADTNIFGIKQNWYVKPSNGDDRRCSISFEGFLFKDQPFILSSMLVTTGRIGGTTRSRSSS
ncbi:unnamed protein product [Prorocentrum cordatum]|uniref:Uncharacterized protein n=1 Tax=Prorocentrum cordatum TaxID=2364126 RepID=A0ABN9WH45_9DINO|nr:unnamed protein product [Polarella glacialis]